MKRNFQILRAAGLACVAVVLSLTNTGCGMKGPLYLPAPASAASQPSNAASK